MGCRPERGDNPRALASGLRYVPVDKHGINIYITYISVDLAHHEIFRAKVGKGGINVATLSSLEKISISKIVPAVVCINGLSVTFWDAVVSQGICRPNAKNCTGFSTPQDSRRPKSRIA